MTATTIERSATAIALRRWPIRFPQPNDAWERAYETRREMLRRGFVEGWTSHQHEQEDQP